MPNLIDCDGFWLASVCSEERARALSEADQRDLAPGAEADAGGGQQLAQSQIALRPAPAGLGARQRGGPARREPVRRPRKTRQEEENRRRCSPQGSNQFISIDFFII